MDQLMTPKQVHAEYGIPLQTLANYRWQGIGPEYVKTNPSKYGRPRYRRSAIEKWLEERTVTTRGAA